jgi:hypothetical protein
VRRNLSGYLVQDALSKPRGHGTSRGCRSGPRRVRASLSWTSREFNHEVPQGILTPILNEAALLAKVPREQLAIVRAEAVVWNDGSLGCPEPGMQYTQALVNGYWVVINAAGQTYDFRVGRDGSFRLCPAGRGRPPLKSDDR